ncbi:MAG: histidine kinase, partial [Deltaproteobacteria bacterium]|nr:histidine kinase [Deltaproteobacteria bacterium]
MKPSVIPTQYAPAEKLSPIEIQAQSALFSNLPYVKHMADALPNSFLALNKHRQIVFANQALLDLVGKKDPEDVYGLRPGEVLRCIHSDKTEGGCGTTEFCKTCGAARAILKAIDGRKNAQECRITTHDGESLDLRAWASPFMNGNQFVSFVLEDISHEKRRRALERIFFHDVLNTAGGVRGLAELLREEDNPQEAGELIDLIQTGTNTLIEEINAQKALSAAETGELIVEPEMVRADDLLKDVSELYENHVVAKDRHIVLQTETQPIEFTTDRTLTKRVLANMTK